MDTTSHISRRVVLIIAALLVVTATTLVGLNAWNLQHHMSAPISHVFSDPYVDGYNAARARYAMLCPQAVNTESRVLSGIVKSVNADSITINQDSLDVDERADGVSNVRTITLTPATPIKQISIKSAAQLAAEFSASPNTKTPPPATAETSLKLTDLKIGTRITVTSDLSVRLLEKIPASSILVLAQP